MTERRSDRFIDALHRLEDEGDVEPIAALFADDATLSNPAHQMRETGPDAARGFWRTYRGTFDEIHSEFRNVVETDGTAALEWRSQGRTSDGKDFRYDGVSVIEYDDGGIHAFRAYFDPTELGVQFSTGRRRARPREPREASDAATG